MRKYVLCAFIVMILALLFISACGNNAEDSKDNSADASSNAAEVNEEADDNVKLDQELVNFKCEIAGMQTIYFFKNRAKITSPNGNAYILDKDVYVEMDFDGEKILVKYPSSEQPDIDTESMMATYHNSKIVPNIECDINVVKESDVALPDMKIITPDELEAKLMDSMMQGMGEIPES